jgi:hypothetical protein
LRVVVCILGRSGAQAFLLYPSLHYYYGTTSFSDCLPCGQRYA